MPKFKEDKKVVLPQEKLRSMMRKTSFAISTDESRYVLNGIFISLKEHKMTMVATDGRRLALVDEDVDVSGEEPGEFIVPAKTVNELNRLLQEKGEVEIRYSENQASFTLKDEKAVRDFDHYEADRGELSELPAGDPGETKERVALGREEFLARVEAGGDHDERKVQLGEADVSARISWRSRPIRRKSARRGKAWPSITRARTWRLRSIPKYMIDPLNALANDEVFMD